MTSSAPAHARLNVHTVQEALEVVPHLLGFHPDESLVAMVIEGGVVVVTARIDLADAVPRGAIEELLERLWTRFPSASAWFVAYTADQGVGWEVLARCDAHLPERAGRRLTLVDGERWRDEAPDGPQGDYLVGHGPVAAAATYHGLPARSSRAELAACFAGPRQEDPAVRDALEAAGGELAGLSRARWPARMVSELQLGLEADELTDATLARLAVLSGHRPSRDAAVLIVSRVDAARHLRLWQAVVNRVPPAASGNALALAGMAAWVAGEGAVVAICLDRLGEAEADPEVPAVLQWVTDEVVPPTVWESMKKGLLESTTAMVRRAVSPPPSRQGT